METKELTTISLGHDEDSGPDWSICPGHVDGATFTKAHENEGWVGDPITDDELTHEFWKKTEIKNGVQHYRKCDPTDVGAEPYTVMSW